MTVNEDSIIKNLGKGNWGASLKVLRKIFNALLRSKLDYGSMVYNSAKPNLLDKLSPINNAGLR